MFTPSLYVVQLLHCTVWYVQYIRMFFLRYMQECAVNVCLPVQKGLYGRDISIRDLLLGEQKREGLSNLYHE